MSEDFVERALFRPFQTTKKKGLGIGLFHSKLIVEAHRGSVEVNSKVGAGTEFRVILPIG
jgi:signal transduction histidine kinase